MKRLLVFPLLALVLGCHSFGPEALHQTHPRYNQAIARSLDEQFLLNLVRLKYRDNPFFLEVASVTASQTLETEVSLGAKFITTADSLSPSAGVTYKQTPTIAFSPLRGDQFLKQLLSPIPLEAVLILTQSGWSVERVVSICVERVNGLDNASNASGPTPAGEPRFRRFREMVEILRELQLADALELGAAPAAEGQAVSHDLVLRLKTVPSLAPRSARLRELLELPADLDQIRLTSDFLNQRAGSVAIRTRSMMGILFYLSHNTRVPDGHSESGLVTITRDAEGRPFDWEQVTGGLFRVHSAEARPVGAFVAVPYRDAWFYLRNEDLESKSTFMLITQLFNLQAGQVKTIAPTRTIGVGN